MRHFWQGWLDGRRRREAWEAGLAWFRLRYREAAGATRCLALLSRPAACGRVALYYRPGVVAELYMGVPAGHQRLLTRMAADFGCLLRPLPAAFCLPDAQPLAAAERLPWDEPFLAHLVQEVAFVTPLDEARPRGAYWPRPATPAARRALATWSLPDPPPVGLSRQIAAHHPAPPAHLLVSQPVARHWPLGRAATGEMLHATSRVNVYGRPPAVAAWLAQLVAELVRRDPANLVVLDGVGDLVPQLKRQAAVTRLLGERLAYLDIEASALAQGFNPLAAVPGETAAATGRRWQQWFVGMGVHPQGLKLVAQAQQAGVGDIPALRRWLRQVERQGPQAALSSLALALERLLAHRPLREWLAWPAERWSVLPAGALFLACPAGHWAGRQLLQGVLLGALAVPGVRLILHGCSRLEALACLPAQGQVVLGNGPRLPQSTVVLTECPVQQVPALAGRFLDDDPVWGESLALLGRGEGLVVTDETIVWAGWSSPVRPVEDL